MTTTKRYPAELKTRAVRMVAERPEGETEWAAMQRIAPSTYYEHAATRGVLLSTERRCWWARFVGCTPTTSRCSAPGRAG